MGKVDAFAKAMVAPHLYHATCIRLEILSRMLNTQTCLEIMNDCFISKSSKFLLLVQQTMELSKKI